MTRKRKTEPAVAAEGAIAEVGDSGRDPAVMLESCQRILRVLTGVMIGAFGLIVLLTTVSTGPFAQVAGRGLYFAILACAAVSLGTWLARLCAERRAGRRPHGLAEAVRKV